MPNYDGRVFVSLENTENGEVDDQTRFAYHQNGFSVWADYAGGDIVRGHQWRLLGWYLDHRGAGAGQ